MPHALSPTQEAAQRRLSFLLELSLQVGNALDPSENADQFLPFLLKRQKLPFGSIWVRSSFLPGFQPELHLHLLSAWPARSVQARRLPLDRRTEAFLALPPYEPTLVGPREEAFALLQQEDRVPRGYFMLYGLGELGFLKLHVPEGHSFLEPQTSKSIGVILEKLAVSLRAGFSHQSRVAENEEKVRLHKESARRDRLYKTVLQSLEEALVITDVQGHPIYANRRFEEMMGYQYRDIRDKPLYQSLTEPAEWPRIEGYIEALKAGNAVNYTREIRNGWGKRLHLSVHIAPYYNEEGALAGTVVALNDITEREQTRQALKQQKEFYETVLNRIPGDIVVFDAEHRYQFINPMAVRDPQWREWLIGRDDFAYCRERGKTLELARRRRRLFEQAADSPQGLEFEEQLTRDDGRPQWMLRRFFPVKDQSGRLKLMIGFGLDITELKHAQAQLMEAKEQAEDLAQAKQQFLATMSHDIRTPMHAILGMARRLEESALSDEQRRHLQTLKTSSRQLLGLINDILDVSKIEAGKVELEPVDFAPRAFLEDIAMPHRLAAEEKGLALAVSLDPHLASALRGDTLRLGQILDNLLGNAVKFTERGRVRLALQVLCEAEGYQSLRIAVEDSGPGISEEQQAAIFELFAQAPGHSARRYGGTGLGLAITRRLLELMGSRIRLDSSPGAGSCFWFALRLPKAAAPPAGRAAEEAPRVDPRGARILLAEDHPVNRELANHMLRELGVTVTAVENGEQAVEATQRESFDLVLMDIQMPVMDGLEATRRIHDTRPDLPVLALTANVMREDYARYREAGLVDTLGKPYDADSLRQMLARWLPAPPARSAEPASSAPATERPAGEVPENAAEASLPEHATTEAPAYDMAHFYKMCNEDAKLFGHMLRLLIQESEGHLEDWAQGVAEAQWVALGRLAHKMKSPLKMIRAEPLPTELKRMERAVELPEAERRALAAAIPRRMEALLARLRAEYGGYLR